MPATVSGDGSFFDLFACRLGRRDSEWRWPPVLFARWGPVDWFDSGSLALVAFPAHRYIDFDNVLKPGCLGGKRLDMISTNELREKYLDFFRTKDHTICPSDVLVPTWDPTVLFTPAGMNQFKDHFLGKVELEFTRAATCQKCLRTGDIENVGRTAYHHTFFEMLGNFSFGDYFKRDAIHWAWEFLTDRKWLGIDPDRLTVTVYLDDDEAADIWQKDIGLTTDRITRMDEYDNFWPAGAPSDGPDGVCGPCSEIFFHPDHGKEVEIWNLVFTQFNRVGDPPDNLQPLPSKNIDTGMGLERTAATLQGVETNFHIDILLPIVAAAAEVCGIRYEFDNEDGRRLRRITDHIRACTFAIHENVYPGPQKENYVIKRLLRRAVLDGHQMGLREPFLFKLVPAVADVMRSPYPEISDTAPRVAAVIESEEKSFFATLDAGLSRIEKIFSTMSQSDLTQVDGQSAFDLYQTYGVPPELFQQIASEKDYTFDWDGFQSAMKEHQETSNTFSSGVMGNFGPIDEVKSQHKSTKFVGYETTESESVVIGIIAAKEPVDPEGPCDPNSVEQQRLTSIDAKHQGTQILVLQQSPFYAESGGQVGDSGTITGPNGQFEVIDTQKNGEIILHYGKTLSGSISEGDHVTATVDQSRRDAIRRAHSATHILHFALQKNLGSHAQQRGSKVTDDWFRFDFTNLTAVDDEQLGAIEKESNERIGEGAPIKAEILPLASAKQQGAMMLFGEKYPDPVRMVSMGGFSKELCGGTHLSNTSEVGDFEIISERLVSAGTRRIEALTGDKASANAQQTRSAVERLAKQLQVAPKAIPGAIDQLAKLIRQLKKRVASGGSNGKDQIPTVEQNPNESLDELSYVEIREILRQSARILNVSMFEVPERVNNLLSERDRYAQQLEQLADQDTIDATALLDRCIAVGDIQLIVEEVPNVNPNQMRGLIDQIRKQTAPVAIFLASIQGADKIMLVAGISKDLVQRGISAGDWVKQVAPTVGGGGGGKPDLAQAGGRQPEKINVALDAAREYLKTATVT